MSTAAGTGIQECVDVVVFFAGCTYGSGGTAEAELGPVATCDARR